MHPPITMTIHLPTRFISEKVNIREFAFSQSVNGGRGRIRTDERTKRADLQSASFSHLDTLPCPKTRFATCQQVHGWQVDSWPV